MWDPPFFLAKLSKSSARQDQFLKLVVLYGNTKTIPSTQGMNIEINFLLFLSNLIPICPEPSITK